MSVLDPAELLASIVDLRIAVRASRDDAVRERLRRIERRLRLMLGPSIGKTVAARTLGVSVTALDNWLDRGLLPLVSTPGSSRLRIETTPLVELAEAVAKLREAGCRRQVIARAAESLGWKPAGARIVVRADIALLPRPNVAAAELREQFALTTAGQRLAESMALSETATMLAAAPRVERRA